MNEFTGKKRSSDSPEFLKISEKLFNPAEEYLGTDKEVNKMIPLVSVLIITYQHAPFIRDCLEGVLMQETDFPVEILIGEDGSTDGTREICIGYAEKYPDKIRLFLRNRETSNYYDKKSGRTIRFNGKWNKKNSRGKYIAVCEGDDYWTDPLKLQKQADFLESNDDYILVVGGYEILDSKTGKREKVIKQIHQYDAGREDGYSFTLETASKVWITKTLTMMYRKKTSEQINKKLYQYIYSRDVHTVYHLLQEGKGFYFTELFGVYRLHDGGVFSSLSSREAAILRVKINRELYQVNREKNSRIMYLLALSSLIKAFPHINKDFECSIYRLYLMMLKLVRTPGEFRMFIRTFRISMINRM